jgi:ubiquinone/menaquinone biosynthesis C-methylase UbiE
VAPHAGVVYAVDLQAPMHEYYGSKGVPENVALVTADVAALPFADGALDRAFSTMTYHEFASPQAIGELRRVLVSNGRLAVVDWAATGAGEAGPPLSERCSAGTARDALETAGFTIEHAAIRPETFLFVATA